MEAPRGALGHWISTNGSGKVANYQCIVPGSWLMSPRDSNGIPDRLNSLLSAQKLTRLEVDYTNPAGIFHMGRSYDLHFMRSPHDRLRKCAPNTLRILKYSTGDDPR